MHSVVCACDARRRRHLEKVRSSAGVFHPFIAHLLHPMRTLGGSLDALREGRTCWEGSCAVMGASGDAWSAVRWWPTSAETGAGGRAPSEPRFGQYAVRPRSPCVTDRSSKVSEEALGGSMVRRVIATSEV